MSASAVSHYNDKVVRQFAIMTVVWGVVGMTVGVLIAAQLLWPALNFDIPWLTYSRLRPLHTNAVIFAFGGSALFATSYYIVQRTCHVRLFSERLATERGDIVVVRSLAGLGRAAVPEPRSPRRRAGCGRNSRLTKSSARNRGDVFFSSSTGECGRDARSRYP